MFLLTILIFLTACSYSHSRPCQFGHKCRISGCLFGHRISLSELNLTSVKDTTNEIHQTEDTSTDGSKQLLLRFEEDDEDEITVN